MKHYDGSRHESAIKLRQSGFSLKEIGQTLHISKSTASLWLTKVPLDNQTIKTLETKRRDSRIKGLSTIQKNRILKSKAIQESATNTISRLDFENKYITKTLCSMLYWGEGNKTGYRVGFINSDPEMISTFLYLFRKSFEIDEKKFRALVHIHEHHNEYETKLFWSKITNIPLSQFTKSYIKPHTKKIIRQNYPGAIRISYGDSQIASELKATYNSLANTIGAW